MLPLLSTAHAAAQNTLPRLRSRACAQHLALGSGVYRQFGLHSVAGCQLTSAAPDMQGAVHAVIMQNRLRHLVEEKHTHNGEMQDKGATRTEPVPTERSQEAVRYARLSAHPQWQPHQNI